MPGITSPVTQHARLSYENELNKWTPIFQRSAKNDAEKLISNVQNHTQKVMMAHQAVEIKKNESYSTTRVVFGHRVNEGTDALLEVYAREMAHQMGINDEETIQLLLSDIDFDDPTFSGGVNNSVLPTQSGPPWGSGPLSEQFNQASDLSGLGTNGLGNCWAIAGFSAAAKINPDAVKDMIIENPAKPGNFLVRFYWQGKPEYVPVTGTLNSSGVTPLSASPSGGWAPPIILKAFTKFANEHQILGPRPGKTGYDYMEGGYAETVLNAVLPPTGASTHSYQRINPNLKSDDWFKQNHNQISIVSTKSDTGNAILASSGARTLVPRHAYSVVHSWLGDDGQPYFRIHNPWASTMFGGKPADFVISLKDLKEKFDGIVVPTSYNSGSGNTGGPGFF